MSLTDHFPLSRRHTGRHRPQEHPAIPEQPPTEAITAVPETDLDLPVPEAQREAERASGPQQVLPAPPALAERTSGPQAVFAPHPGTGPQPQVPRTSGPHGVLPPLPQRVSAHRRAGMQHTREFAPDFTQTAPAARPYAPRNSVPVEETMYPEAHELPESIGDTLAKEWPGPGESPNCGLDTWNEDLSGIAYPGRDLNASFGDYCDLLRRVNEITGTTGTRLWPLQALPAADKRWHALKAEALDAARRLEDDDPVQAAAYRRLHRYVTAAPDCETAVRLAELAAEARVIDRKLPAATRAQAAEQTGTAS